MKSKSFSTPIAQNASGKNPVRQIDSQTLFAGAKEIEIIHNEVRYRLQQTSLGKLILTK